MIFAPPLKNLEVRYNVAAAHCEVANLEVLALTARLSKAKADYIVTKGKFKVLLGRLVQDLEQTLKKAQLILGDCRQEEAQALHSLKARWTLVY